MRIVKHQYAPEDLQALQRKTNVEAIFSAIGYLSTWGMTSPIYDECTLSISSDHTEMTAVYRQEDGVKVQYVLGAVWHGDRFGFHS